MMLSIYEALKKTRRGIHVYGSDWRTLVITQKNRQVSVARDEVARALEGSSVSPVEILLTRNIIRVNKGAEIRIAAVEDLTDAYLLSGHTYTQMIWLYEPDLKVSDFMRAMLRSNDVPAEQLRTDYVDW